MKELDQVAQRGVTGDFSPKTDEAGRIAIIAMYTKMNAKQNVLAKVFGMNRRTVRKLIDQNSGDYVHLKSKVAKMTDEELRAYITDELIDRVNIVAKEMDEIDKQYSSRPLPPHHSKGT